MEGKTPVNTKLLVAIFAVAGMASGLHGADFQPVTCKGLFNDVPEANDFCPWIEQLAADQVSAGCGDKKFCPDQPVTRQQAAELLEKAMRGTATWQVDAGTLDGLDSSAFVTAASLSWRSLRRKYYLDYPSFSGDHALEACTAPGFHVASIWEIQDLGTLVYDSQLGVGQPDSGNGPPTGAPGWVRTGAYPSNLNCQLWTTAAGKASWPTFRSRSTRPSPTTTPAPNSSTSTSRRGSSAFFPARNRSASGAWRTDPVRRRPTAPLPADRRAPASKPGGLPR